MSQASSSRDGWIAAAVLVALFLLLRHGGGGGGGGGEVVEVRVDADGFTVAGRRFGLLDLGAAIGAAREHGGARFVFVCTGDARSGDCEFLRASLKGFGEVVEATR